MPGCAIFLAEQSTSVGGQPPVSAPDVPEGFTPEEVCRREADAWKLGFESGKEAAALQAGVLPDLDRIEDTMRQGRKVGRTLYLMVGTEASDDDVLVGLVDTPELAQAIVEAYNARSYPPETTRLEMALTEALRESEAERERLVGVAKAAQPLGIYYAELDDLDNPITEERRSLALGGIVFVGRQVAAALAATTSQEDA